MGTGKDIYEETRRLKAERALEQERRWAETRDRIAERDAMDARTAALGEKLLSLAEALLDGSKVIVLTPGGSNRDGYAVEIVSTPRSEG